MPANNKTMCFATLTLYLHMYTGVSALRPHAVLGEQSQDKDCRDSSLRLAGRRNPGDGLRLSQPLISICLSILALEKMWAGPAGLEDESV